MSFTIINKTRGLKVDPRKHMKFQKTTKLAQLSQSLNGLRLECLRVVIVQIDFQVWSSNGWYCISNVIIPSSTVRNNIRPQLSVCNPK